MPFTILNHDITKMKVDAIVNSTNNFDYGSGGADYDIYQAAGPDLIKERAALGFIPIGEARITKGYNLPAQHIIHVVAPYFIDGQHGEEQALIDTYMAALTLSAQRKMKSIAFPLIASGAGSFPWRIALRIALTSVREFLKDHEMMIYVLVYEGPHYGQVDTFEYARRHNENQKPEPSEETFVSTIEAHGGSPVFDPRTDDKATFASTLFWWIDKLNLKETDVYKNANLDRKLFSKIRKNLDYQPSKNTAIALALALNLTFEDTNILLAKAGYVLSPSLKFDRIIIEFIKKGNFDLYEINATLFELELKMIGFY